MREGHADWSLGVALAIGGFAAVVAGAGPWAAVVANGGMALLLARALLRMRPTHRRLRATIAGVGTVLVFAGTLTLDFAGAEVRPLGILMGTAGSQLVLLALGMQRAGVPRAPPRAVLLAVGHGMVLVGFALASQAPDGQSAIAGLASMAGFAPLLLHAVWVRRGPEGAPPEREAWERLLLVALSAGLAALTANAALSLTPYAPPGGAAAAEHAVRTLLLLGLAVLAEPPPAPRWLQARSPRRDPVLLHGIALAAVAYAVLAALMLALPEARTAAFALLTGWLLVAVAFEYMALGHALRKPRGPQEPARGAWDPLTVIVAAMNEAQVLPRSLEANLAIPMPLHFVVVVAGRSDDGTLEAVQRVAERHAGRVRVLRGEGRSKAEDLNQAWEHVDTSLVLILDADEIIGERALRIGLGAMAADPELGVVQGRKLSGAPDASRLARFIAAERRFSTLLDHALFDGVFGAAHFAGSGALLRRQVPRAVRGWSPATLTEDIEFTVRLLQDSGWKVRYEPAMLVRESDPRTFRQLVRQRSRWARGWSEVNFLHIAKLVRLRNSVGPWRALGYAWQLVTAVSAPWSVLLPLLAVMWAGGAVSFVPQPAAWGLAAVVLPSRALAYAYASWSDPDAPRAGRAARSLEAVLMGYLWIPFGWAIQLHGLYLETASLPRVWQGTDKSARTVGAPLAGEAPRT